MYSYMYNKRLAQSDHVQFFTMHVLSIVPGCILFLHCLLCAMAHRPGNRDLKQLFAGSEPTKRNGPSIGARTSLLAHVKIEQGKEVFEYAKLFFEPSVLETAVQQGTIRLPRNFWKGFVSRYCKKEK